MLLHLNLAAKVQQRMMKEEISGVGMAASAARETASQKAKDLMQKRASALAKRFGMAVEEITKSKLASDETVEYEAWDQWVVLKVYLHNSTRRLLNNKPPAVIRGVLANYLNVPFKITQYPAGVGQHWLRTSPLTYWLRRYISFLLGNR
ncbi:MAG: hypothetical protein ACUVUS_07200 [Thermoproteota archaeon]